jgi:hypothetical protein
LKSGHSISVASFLSWALLYALRNVLSKSFLFSDLFARVTVPWLVNKPKNEWGWKSFMIEYCLKNYELLLHFIHWRLPLQSLLCISKFYKICRRTTLTLVVKPYDR